jgi:hypothetical protein
MPGLWRVRSGENLVMKASARLSSDRLLALSSSVCLLCACTITHNSVSHPTNIPAVTTVRENRQNSEMIKVTPVHLYWD